MPSLRRAAQRAAALGLGLALLGSSGLALADGHHGGQDRGHHRNQQLQLNFSNLGSNQWAQAALRLMAAQGVMQGVGGGQLDAQGPSTRAEMATMLGRLLGWNTSAPQPPATPSAGPLSQFADAGSIPPWAQAYVQLAVQQGILRGESDHRFAPNQNVTWAQAAVIIARTFSFPSVSASAVATELQQLPYGPDTPEWAAAAVAADVQAGLFQGLLGEIYMPNAPISRAELAALLQAAELLKPAVVAQANSIVVGDVQSVQAGGLTVLTSQGQVSVTLASSPVVFLGSSQGSVSDLAAGEHVVIGVDASDQGAFVEITSGAPPTTTTSANTVSGTVEAISGTQISLQSGANLTTYDLGPNLQISGTSSLAAIVPTDQVTLTINSANLVTAIDVTAGPSQATVAGAVTVINSQFLTVKASSGESFSYVLAPNVTVSGLETSLNNVTTGDQVSLTLNGSEQITAIDVTATSQPPATGTVTGTFVSANAAASTVTLLVYSNNQAQLATVLLASGATVTLSGSASSPGALPVGVPTTLSTNAQGQAVSVTASALPAGETSVTGELVGESSTMANLLVNGSLQGVTLGSAPIEISGGQIVATGTVPLDVTATVVTAAVNGSALLVAQ